MMSETVYITNDKRYEVLRHRTGTFTTVVTKGFNHMRMIPFATLTEAVGIIPASYNVHI